MGYDVIIIGAASAGIPAAIYAKRFGLQTLLIGAEIGGLLNESQRVENWPGEQVITGMELMNKFKLHVESLGVPIKTEWVKKLSKDEGGFSVVTDHDAYRTRAIIYAAGSKHRHLGVPGEEELAGKGVSYCATCDAAFFKRVPVIVVGGGDAAAQGALQLAQHASKVYVAVRRDVMRAEPINQERIKAEPKITILYETRVSEILGEQKVTGVRLTKPSEGKEILPVEGVFIQIGAAPQSQLARSVGVKVNEQGEIIIDDASRTNIPRFYAAGDVTNRKYKQAITGAAEGVIAAFSAFEDLGRG